jgi:hypothetical protein
LTRRGWRRVGGRSRRCLAPAKYWSVREGESEQVRRLVRVDHRSVFISGSHGYQDSITREWCGGEVLGSIEGE